MKVVVFFIKVYRRASDLLVMMGFPSMSCRFHPTCSFYMEEAVEKYGVTKGVWKGVLRIGRCHPFFKGGFDPVK